MTDSDRARCLELYQDWKKREAKLQENIENKRSEEYMLRNVSHTDNKSREMTNELIKRIFSKIYEYLVDKNSNVIVGNNLDITQLPEKIVNMLTPLLTELKDQNETLTLNEFHLAGKHLYNFLPYDEKLYLWDWYSVKSKIKKENNENALFTFKVSIII